MDNENKPQEEQVAPGQGAEEAAPAPGETPAEAPAEVPSEEAPAPAEGA